MAETSLRHWCRSGLYPRITNNDRGQALLGGYDVSGGVLREPLLRAWIYGPHARRQPTTSEVSFTSKLISGGFTWVTPCRCFTLSWRIS